MGVVGTGVEIATFSHPLHGRLPLSLVGDW